MKRLLPSGLAGRFVLLLTVALILANAVALILLASERDRLGRAAREEGAVARFLALAPLLDGTSQAERERRIRAAGQRGARLTLSQTPNVAADVSGVRARALAEVFEATLEGRALRLADAPRRNALDISVALYAPDAWLNGVLNLGPPPRRTGGFEMVIVALGLSLLAVLGVGLVFVRQLTRPLADLAQAARAAGRGDRSARMPEEGAAELREAATAFNDMQAQIARFDAERTRTFAAVGHDLRTPITSLRIRAEMLDPEDGAPMIATLEDMQVMAEGLVAFGTGTHATEDRQPVDLHALVTRLCTERGAQIGNIAPAVIDGHPVGLSRAIGNLIDNALRFAGSATVSVEDSRDAVCITVEDRGPGIPTERLEAVQDPFVRGDPSRNTQTGGAGLGLSIVRTVAVDHGGELILANRDGGGLRATIRLPRKSRA